MSNVGDREEAPTQDSRILEMMDRLMERQEQRFQELEDRMIRAGGSRDETVTSNID